VIGLRTVNPVYSVPLPVGVQIKVVHRFFCAARRTISPSQSEYIVNRLARLLGTIDAVSVAHQKVRLDLLYLYKQQKRGDRRRR
jgi:hypothetical protein